MSTIDYNPQNELDRIKTIRTLFEMEGWALFMEDMQNNLRAVAGLAGIEGLQSLGNRQGQTGVLEGILNYEGLVDATESQINADIEAEVAADA
tara:strand:- start:3238 stop:3516 length:279 start_codon:yes stop_codon:yes gene_type:complete